MPHLTVSPRATRNLLRLFDFLEVKSPSAAVDAVRSVRASFPLVAQQPGIGRRVDSPVGAREWVVPFGHSAYRILYLHAEETVIILAVRHSRERGYR